MSCNKGWGKHWSRASYKHRNWLTRKISCQGITVAARNDLKSYIMIVAYSRNKEAIKGRNSGMHNC